jgi:hypothetical protein
MKLRKEILMNIQEELKDKIAIVNKSDLDKKGPGGTSNWSAEFQVNSKLGKKPYKMENFQYVPVEHGRELKDAIYLRDNEVQELNLIGKGVANLMNTFDEKGKEYGAYKK